MTPPPWLHDLALLLLRLAFGGLMVINHGLGKVDKLAAGGDIEWADPLGLGPELSLTLAASAEAGAATLVVLGLFTRLATIPLAFTMSVAAFVVHADDPLSKQEPSLLFLTAYLVIFALGPGRLSLSRALSGLLPGRGWLGFLLR